jgi:DNA-binding response OmpR family regulator
MNIMLLGNYNVYRRIAGSVRNSGIKLHCETDVYEAARRMKLEQFDLILIDSGIDDLERICSRLSWLGRVPVAVLVKSGSVDWKMMNNLNVEGFIPVDEGRVEMIACFQAIVRRFIARSSKIKILAIEDDEYTQESLKMSLDIYWPEAEMFFAGSGGSGIKALLDKKPDIILLDLVLPDVSGLEVLKTLRLLNGSPVIMISGDNSRENIVNSILLGASDYILKPYESLDLLSRIRNQVNRKSLMNINAN